MFKLLLIHIVLELRCNMMGILHTETSGRVNSLIIEGHTYWKVSVLKHKNISYECTTNRVNPESPRIILSKHWSSINMWQMSERQRLKNYGYCQGKSLEVYLLGLLPSPRSEQGTTGFPFEWFYTSNFGSLYSLFFGVSQGSVLKAVHGPIMVYFYKLLFGRRVVSLAIIPSSYIYLDILL